MKKIGFLGTGNMGFAIMNGISNSNIDDITLYAFDVNESAREKAVRTGAMICTSECDLVEKCDYIFLAVKPQVLPGVLETIRPAVTNQKVIVSIAAGITGEYLKSQTIDDLKAVLVMPNTPLLLGCGATALAKVDPVSDEEFGLICSIFAACGRIAVLPADRMKEIIAINGSSPAFIYLFAKGFIEYAKSVDIPEETSSELFAATLTGSAKMITDSGYSIDELIKMVSSPGGTTLAGLDRLYEGNLTQVVINACDSCTKRAYELSDNNK
ncbi:MAG: pyrroline-5-carboxylate reductase [Oscillospiraceae bacterium]|nr:pyrroline-5-carboxylate reductase [Oscillospiraceae bacterium]